MTITVEIKNVSSSWDMALKVYKKGKKQTEIEQIQQNRLELKQMPMTDAEVLAYPEGEILTSGKSTQMTTWDGDAPIIVKEVRLKEAN